MEKRRSSILTRIAELTWREPTESERSDHSRPVRGNANPTSERIRNALRRWFEEEL
jgi:hypothetical protein